MTTQTFQHKAHVITLNASTGVFVCSANGKTLTTESLSGMKKKLDALVKFVPFKALYTLWDDTKKVTVTGVGQGRGRARGNKVFRLSNGRETYEAVEDTPANHKLLKKRAALRAAGQKRKDAENRAVNAIDEAITRRKPE